VVKDEATGKVVLRREIGPNIVTTFGDKYYAQSAARNSSNAFVATPSITFHRGMLVVAKSYGNGSGAPGKLSTFRGFTGIATSLSGRQSFDAGYPKTGDTDTDNTGRTADALTYKRTYATNQANYTIKALGICQYLASSGSAAGIRQLLSAKALTAAQQVTKTSSQTLVVYVNHTFQGV
jgi:hypothetical protein